jgi:glycosyltransferase involved in cell wall biosynthesis
LKFGFINAIMDNNITFISMRMSGHAGPSGYDRLADFLEADVIYPISDWTIPKRLLLKCLDFIPKHSASLWYHRRELSAELRAVKKWFKKKNQIFHFLYGENCYRYLGTLNIIGHRNFIVCTYHTPPERFCRVVKDRGHFKRLDAVIVVSTTQHDFFSEIVGPDKVFYVPHGIDVDYFKPINKKKPRDSGFQCLFVGSHLRDFKTLAKSARLLESNGEKFHFSVVTSTENHHHFIGIKNVSLFSGLSDQELLEIYQNSHLLTLPLLDGTANNSLLEAMATGMPVVATDLQGIRDYVDDACSILIPKGDAKALAETIKSIADDEAKLERMALASRNRALDFSWQKIAAKTMEVYNSLTT